MLYEVITRQPILETLALEIAAAQLRAEQRAGQIPAIRYPAELPVSQKKDEIAAAIAAHQVVIVAGETGSGKTTQLPKICLEAGRGIQGLIGHTQPRRLAARSVASRIAVITSYSIHYTKLYDQDHGRRRHQLPR